MERQGLQIDKAESVLGRGGGGGSVVPAGAFGLAGATRAARGAGMRVGAGLDWTLKGGKTIPRGEVRRRGGIVGEELGTQADVGIEGMTDEADVGLVAGGRTIEAIGVNEDIDGGHPNGTGKTVLVDDGIEGLLGGDLKGLTVRGPGLARIERGSGGSKGFGGLTNHGPVESNKANGGRRLVVGSEAIKGGKGIPERGLVFLGTVHPSIKRGQKGTKDAGLVREADGTKGGAADEKSLDFLAEAGDGGVGKLGGVTADGLEVGRTDVEVKLGGEADGAHHADGVFAETNVGVADGTDTARLEVAEATYIVDDGEVIDVVEESVDGEVTAKGIFLRGTEGVVLELIEPVGLIGDGVRRRGLAEGGSLNDLFAKDDMGQAETTADEVAVTELALDFVGARISADIEIFWGTAEKEVADGTADKVSLVTELREAIENLKGIGVDVAAGDVVLGSGDDCRFGLSVEEEHVADTFV